MTYQETLDFMFAQLPMYHRIGAAAYKADLQPTLDMMEALGHPERRFRSIHVAGTNGKGSVSHMLASILQEAGYKVGLYTSPHLVDFRERIRINGDMIPEQEVVDFIAHHSSLITKRFICVTFDDGYRDNYTLAYPLLKRLGVPFTVYVTSGFIDNRLPMWWYSEQQLGISTEELRKLDADPLCTIGAHTVSHPKLDTLSYEEQYKEIANSKQELEQLLGQPVQHFSFPHGAHNADTLAICRELGFKTNVMAWDGPVRLGNNRFLMPRMNMKQP